MDREIIDDLSGVPKEHAPSDPEAEKAILSLCIKKPSILNDILGKRLVLEDFYDERHRTIFEEITRLYLENEKIDRVTLADSLTRHGKQSAAGGMDYIYEVANTFAVASNSQSYTDIIVQKSRMRQLMKILGDLQAKTASGTSDVNDVVDLGINLLTEMRQDSEGEGFEALRSIISRSIEAIHKEIRDPSKKNAFRSGFRMLDSIIGGFKPGTLNIIAARPGVGKTALVINMATHMAVVQHRNVNIFSLEMSKTEIGNRIISARSQVSVKDLQRATITPEQEKALDDVCDELKTYSIYIDDRSDVNPVLMTAKLKDLKAQGKLGLVVVDYLQLMSAAGLGRHNSRQEEVAAISRSLKILAKEMHVPVIALSQLARSAEKHGNDHTPQLSDLRDSGAIEQDADSVIFINRADLINKKNDDDDDGAPASDSPTSGIVDAELIVAKNRHGGTGRVKLKFWGERTLFFEPDPPSYPEDPVATGAQSRHQSSANYDFGDDGDNDDNVVPPFEDDDGEQYSNPENADFFDGADSDDPDGDFI